MSLVLQKITKKYKEKTVLDDVRVVFEPKKIYGLLGRNGAGKSTLLNIIANRSFASAGQVMLDDKPIEENELQLNKIYLMSEDNLFPANMKVKNIFKITEAFYGSFDWTLANRMIADFEVNEKLTFRKLSTGYRSIIKLIAALCVPCEYIFLDEPILGLDANHREAFYEYLIETYDAHPRSFIISTHLIEEITNLLENVVILDHGKILVQDSVEHILNNVRSISGPREILMDYAKNLNVLAIHSLGALMTVYTDQPVSDKMPDELSMQAINLQDYFIQLTQRKRLL